MNNVKRVRSRLLTYGSAALAGSLCVAGSLGVIAGAGASTTSTATSIGPNQVFGALVNGKKGVTKPVTIWMACGGPVSTTSTGHPVGGQTVRVFEPKGTKGPLGNTGANGDEIGAFYGAPPPSAVVTRAAAATDSTVTTGSSGPVWFQHYATRKIPTSEILPCGGTGNVIFVPLPMSPGSEVDVVVPVIYVSLGVGPTPAIGAR